MNLLFRVLLLVALYSPLSLSSQTSGIVRYEEDITLDLPPDVKAMLKDMPDNIQSNKVLKFDGNKMSYTDGEQAESDERGRGNRRMRFIRRSSSSGTQYFDFDSGIVLATKNAFRKEFIVKDTIQNLKWKISPGEHRDIAGYTCMKASYLRDSTTIEAWFTPQIPINFGPDGLHGLPGLILAVGYGPDKAILAKEITLDPEDPVSLDVVEDDKDALTRSEYEKLVEEKRAEMEKMWGGNRKRRDARRGR